MDEGPLFAIPVDQASELGSDEHADAETIEEVGYGSGRVRASRRSIDQSTFDHTKEPSVGIRRII